jgi:hypothetical protein
MKDNMWRYKGAEMEENDLASNHSSLIYHITGSSDDSRGTWNVGFTINIHILLNSQFSYS